MRKRKNSTPFVIAACYLVAALITSTIAFRAPDKMFEILLTFLISCAVSALLLFLLFKLYKRSVQKHNFENLTNIMNSINAMAMMWDADFSYFEVNRIFTETTGYTAEDLKDRKILEKVLPEDAFAPSLQAIISSRDEEFNIKAKDGSDVCTIWTTSLMNKITSKKYTRYIMLSIGTNLSESVRMREELTLSSQKIAEAERKYNMAMSLSEIGLILTEPETGGYYVSDQLRKMTGLQSESITLEDFKKLVHPKDVIKITYLSEQLKKSENSAVSSRIYETDFRVKKRGEYEWFQLRYRIISMEDGRLGIGGSVMNVTKEKEKDEKIEYLAYIDEVTEVFNRNRFLQLGQELFELSKELETGYWVIVADIDSFHIVNDTCGYLNGNRLLNEFAKIVKKSAGDTSIVARIGGDNIAIISEDKGDPELPVKLIKNIQKNLVRLNIDVFATQTITCSAGYCLMSDGGDNFASILDYAEFSLSLSDGSRSSIIRYDHKIHDLILESVEIEKELAAAIENKELVLYYQPKINLEDGSLIGAEALIRWRKPDGTIIFPNKFIPIAESSNLITKISRFVLHEACRQNKEWQDKGYPGIAISVNLTAIDFYQTEVTDIIMQTLFRTGLSPKWLDIELTESLALKDIDQAVVQMNEIKNLGVVLSLDDFGTGYSSLSYIQKLPISVLKLDRSFVMYINDDEISREIVSAVIKIAKSKKIETIAEGIETEEQAEMLKSLGCDQAQGYLFGRPMPADKFEQFIEEHQKVMADR